MNYLLRLVRDRRGTASVEAAVMLPLMALCWAALFFRFQDIEQELDIAVEARRDAWLFSARGCEVDHGDPPAPPGIGMECNTKGDGQTWMNTLEHIPFVGFLVTSFTGFELTKVARGEHKIPNMLGGGTSHLAYPYALMCNEKKREDDYLLTSCICQTVGSLGLSLDFAVNCPDPPNRGTDCKQQP